MSNKPSIPAWQRASTDNAASSSPPEQDAGAQQQPVEAPTPTEDDTESEDGGVQLSESSESGELLEQASRFLDDPTIRDAPREKKVAFLESKGVSAGDIESLLGEKEEDVSREQSVVETSPVEEGESERVEEHAEEEVWPSSPPRAASAPEYQPQPREIPPIVTYPEFLASTEKPPPLITTSRLVNTAYITGGLMASIYGLSKFIIAPMTEKLAESRHDFASHTQAQLKEFNERLSKAVSVDPATKVKAIKDILDDVSEADSDPTELYHRDYGTQTTPNLSRRPSTSSPSDPHPAVTAHENRLKIMKIHLEEMETTSKTSNTSRDALRTKVSDLTSYLSEMDYQSQYYPNMGRYGSNFNWMSGNSSGGKNDQIEVLKGDIRAVKGVFLSARNFPTGWNAPPIPTGRAT